MHSQRRAIRELITNPRKQSDVTNHVLHLAVQNGETWRITLSRDSLLNCSFTFSCYCLEQAGACFRESSVLSAPLQEKCRFILIFLVAETYLKCLYSFYTDRQRNPHTRMSWVPLVLGILTALVTVVAMTLIFLRKRRKETRFG